MKEIEPTKIHTIAPMELDDTEGVYNLLRTSHLDTYINDEQGITFEKLMNDLQKQQPRNDGPATNNE